MRFRARLAGILPGRVLRTRWRPIRRRQAMTDDTRSKLLPRNVAALRRFQDPAAAPREVTGNPVMTRLESGIGNCFPGLECDLRNLERRFFPFLEIEINFSVAQGIMQVAAVDLPGVEAAAGNGGLPAADAANYRTIAQDLRNGAGWVVSNIAGDFGPFKQQTFNPDDLTGSSFGNQRLPPEPWAAVRTLVEGTPVTLTLVRRPAPGTITLTGNRARYLDDTGALARMFQPGELTQSLCSPWTHDFRDCACFYWASNHPDIALPPLPAPPPPAGDPRWELATAWERADRSVATPPVATQTGSQSVPEIAHHAINRHWQLLNFVLERRERISDYAPTRFNAVRLPNQAALVAELRYAAGVEIAAMQEYLTAAWSLRPTAAQPEPLLGDLTAAFDEMCASRSARCGMFAPSTMCWLACRRPEAKSKAVAGRQGRALGDRPADPVCEKRTDPHGCPDCGHRRKRQGVGLDDASAGSERRRSPEYAGTGETRRKAAVGRI